MENTGIVFFGLEFISPEFLYLLILVPIIVLMRYHQRKRGMKVGFLNDLVKVYKRSSFYSYVKVLLESLILIIFILLLSNPNSSNIRQKISRQGVDLIVALDISTSMLEQDIKPNRLEGAKQVLSDFTAGLSGDRMGIILFAGKPFISSPLTFDHGALGEFVENISTDTINQGVYGLQGTAIGDAVLMAVDNFDAFQKTEEEKERESVLILISDGKANKGVNPEVAATYAKDNKIKIFTVGIGSSEPRYKQDMFGRSILMPALDEKGLKLISEITDGQYFNAKNIEELKSSFKSLSDLKKKEIKTEVIKEYHPRYDELLGLLIFLIIGYLFFRSVKITII